MNSSTGLNNPLSYMGVRSSNPPVIIFKNYPPTENDIENVKLGDIWLDRITDNVYMLVDKSGMVATWSLLGSSSASIEAITTPDTNVVTPVNDNINFVNGTGMAITGSGENITFSVTSNPFKIQWNTITTATETMVVDEGYFADRAGGVILTLPATAAVGDFISIVAVNAGGFKISQNAGQQIFMGNQSTTSSSGSLSSTAIGDSLYIVCSVQDTEFIVTSTMGNFIVA